MPKSLWITDDMERDGIQVEWTKSRQRLCISGWYDSRVGIEGKSLTLREFFDALGIKKTDCDKAFKGE